MTEQKPKKPRKGRVDSVDAAVNIAQAALKDIRPPKHVRLEKKDMPFFDSIIAEFANAEWTDHQLELAAMLARTMCDMEEQQFQLRKEGPMLKMKSKKNKNTYQMVNPRKAVVQMYAGTIFSMRRTLSLHARAREGESRDISKRRAEKKGIQNGIGESADDDLINRPQAAVN